MENERERRDGERSRNSNWRVLGHGVVLRDLRYV